MLAQVDKGKTTIIICKMTTPKKPKLSSLKPSQWLKINNNHKMITYDIKDLYVNIPTYETIKIAKIQLLKNDKQKTKQIITILKTILEQNYFVFQDMIYHPNKGVVVGSSISGTMAELFPQYTENMHIKQMLDSKNIIFSTRYADDILMIIIYKISLFATSKNEMCSSYVNWGGEHENHNKNASLATVFEL